MGHPVGVVVDARWVGRPAYLAALRARAYSAAQLSAKETGWQKEKKSSSACDSQCLNPAAGRLCPALLDRVTVGRGSCTQWDVRPA